MIVLLFNDTWLELRTYSLKSQAHFKSNAYKYALKQGDAQ